MKDLLKAFPLLFLLPLSASAQVHSPANYRATVERFNRHIADQVAEITQASGGYRLPSSPFLMVHGKPAKHSIVLMHGLGDSPYFMRDLAKLFYGHGYDVVAPLLPGNGTRMEDLGKVSREDWKKEVTFAYETAQGLGEKVSLGGMSAGGALAVWAGRKYSGDVEAVYLFSPALFFGHWVTRLTCFRPQHLLPNQGSEVPIRYSKTSNNGTCQLVHLVDELDLQPGHVSLACPIFLCVTESDDVINVQRTVYWVESQPGDHRILAYVKEGVKSDLEFDDLDHEILVPTQPIKQTHIALRSNGYDDEFNPRFVDLESSLLRFINRPTVPNRN